ncbi:pilus assembly protein, partial [Trichloromonas sp.]|uniref:pilus assembly protein n=1 Tax=Trichloromonas sp. TaxID=3069249 RepID=UPI003D81A725
MKKLGCVLAVVICLTWPALVVAEDLDIYGIGSVDVKPNVLIIFDNSGSMTSRDIVPAQPYDKNKTYSGPFASSKIFNKTASFPIVEYGGYVDSLAHVTCDRVRPVATDLGNQGVVENTKIKISGNNKAICSEDPNHTETLYMGNYLNYMRTRLEVAQEAVVNLLNATDMANFGLMTFNAVTSGSPPNSDGGRVVQAIGAQKATLIPAVNGVVANAATPLPEALAEAGLYFAGKTSFFNKSGSAFIRHTSPIAYPCQKNYIILMTDGEPYDVDTMPGRSYLGAPEPALTDAGVVGVAGSLLDDVAAYLQTKDLRSDLGAAGDQFEKQTVTTYTIGFKTDQPLLRSTATRGGGAYFTAQNSLALKDAFDTIIDSIQERNASFVAPVVPASSGNRAFAGDRIYMGFFKPKQSGRWRGNLKAYKLTAAGGLLDKNDRPATDADGMIKLAAQSLWSTVVDGYEVDKGGAGGNLITNDSRKIYTYLDGNTPNLFDSSNRFVDANAGLTATLLGVEGLGAALRADLIRSVRAEDSEWPLGDIVHSEPVTQYHLIDTNSDGAPDTTKTYIYVGANDGMLHAFDGDDGSEVWAFVPPDQLARLKKLGNGTHDYFVDGSPSLFSDGTSKTLIFGERRGGVYYYALDVTIPLQPVLKYHLTEAHLEVLDWDNSGDDEIGEGAALGQSWSRPQPIRLKIGEIGHDVFLLTGGYDVNQDAVTPAATDSAGRAIYAIAAGTGTVTGLNVNGALWSAMTHCILDATPIDRDYNGYVNRVYAGDLGGNLFALRDDNYDGDWERHKLFDLPAT